MPSLLLLLEQIERYVAKDDKLFGNDGHCTDEIHLLGKPY
jgi:hypothetical protein